MNQSFGKLNHLASSAKWLSVRLRTKLLLVRTLMQSLNCRKFPDPVRGKFSIPFLSIKHFL